MAFTYTNAVKDAMLAALVSEAGSNPRLKIYDGSVPASANASVGSSVLLANLPCSTSLGSSSGGTLTCGAITATAAAASGTATYFRITTSGGTAVCQGTVGAGSGDIDLGSTTITSGVDVEIDSLAIVAGN